METTVGSEACCSMQTPRTHTHVKLSVEVIDFSLLGFRGTTQIEAIVFTGVQFEAPHWGKR